MKQSQTLELNLNPFPKNPNPCEKFSIPPEKISTPYPLKTFSTLPENFTTTLKTWSKPLNNSQPPGIFLNPPENCTHLENFSTPLNIS